MKVTLTGSNVTYDIYALVVGDMNTSFNPSSAKGGASETLLLNNGQNRKADPGTDVELPIRILHASGLTAASLILNYPDDLFEVTGVEMKFENGNLDWAAKGGELRAGWNSLQPFWFVEDEVLMTIHGKISESFGEGDEIRFTLAPDLLNELADDYFNVIPDAVLDIDVLAFSTTGIMDDGTWTMDDGTLKLTAHPNPFTGYTMVDFRLPKEGHVTLEISDMMGRRVALLVDEHQAAGKYSVKLDAISLQPGVYMATLKLETTDGNYIKTIKLVRQQ
jgi:hypothetical protein